jgi:aldose 1-epimerase
VTDPHTGHGVRLTLGEGFGWLHVFSYDMGDDPRRALAVEPTTCPPDAFRTGTDLVVLEPGQAHRASFTLTGS